MGTILQQYLDAELNIETLKSQKFIRLAKMFGLESSFRIEKKKGCLGRVVQGEPFPQGSEYRPYESLREAYADFSGDVGINYFGKGLRVAQIAALPTFENSVANICNLLLMKDYAATTYRWNEVITSITDPQDFRLNERIRLKYFPDIPSLTEDEPYLEVQLPAKSDEAVSYTINETGCLLSCSRRMVINDEIGALQRAVAQIGRATWRTLAKRVWSMFTANATYQPDGLPLFHANHGNLGSAALSASALTAARAALFAQTESNSTDRLGLGGGPLLLVIPIQLEATAMPLNHAKWIELDTTGGTGTPVLNPWVHRFGPLNENIFVNPLLVEDDDWYLFDISGSVQIAEVGFLQGRQNPEFIQSSPSQTDAAFYQDRTIFKLHHSYECVPLDFRGCYKSVAP